MRLIKNLLLLLPVALFISCSSQQSGLLVAEYGNTKISLDEFEQAYSKNSGGLERAKADSVPAYEKFLDLYVNYKMKLRDAEVRGFRKDADLEQEYIDYKYNLGKTIFLEKELIDPALKLLYDRKKIEYRASHIFLMEDSINTKEKIDETVKTIYQRINKGEDFNQLVKEFSKDNETKNKGGDVYYFTAGQISSPTIEDAIYSLKVGQVYPEAIQMGIGRHIIKATEIRPRKHSIHVAHILASYQDTTGVRDSLKTLKKIELVDQELKKGAKFEDLAKLYSDDAPTKANGGDIGDFERGRLIREMDEVAFNLKMGEISKIIKTQFGFHIIKVSDEKPIPSFESSREELKNLFQRYRYKNDYDNLIGQLKKEFNFSKNQTNIINILTFSDTFKITPAYFSSKLQSNFGSLSVLSINNKQFSLDSLINFMVKQQSLIGKFIQQAPLNEGIDLYSGELALRAKAESYDKISPSFAKLMDDYRNGMYLFKISEEEVWNKVSIDSLKLAKFWQNNKDNYKWNDRVEFKEIFCFADSSIRRAYSQISSGVNFDSVYAKYNQRSGYENKPGYNGLVDVKFNTLAVETNSLAKINDVSRPFKSEDGWSIVKLIRKDSARLKTFDEAKAEAASILQENESKRLETEYINRLKALYKPKLYNDNLIKAFKN